MVVPYPLRLVLFSYFSSLRLSIHIFVNFPMSSDISISLLKGFGKEHKLEQASLEHGDRWVFIFLSMHEHAYCRFKAFEGQRDV